MLHEDARGRRREEDEAPQRLILERLKGRRKSGEAAERRRRGAAGAGDGAAVAAGGGKRPARRGDGIKVLEHALEDAHWHNLAHVLSLHRRLERDADDVAVAHRRPAAVPVVDGRVDRHDEVRLAALRVLGPINARDDAARDRDAVAADGEADDVDVLLEARRLAERQLDRVEPEGVARDRHDREVGLVRDGEDLRHVLVKVAILAHLQRRGERDDVRVRNDEPTARRDDEAAPRRRLGRGARPRTLPIVPNRIRKALHDAFELRAHRRVLVVEKWARKRRSARERRRGRRPRRSIALPAARVARERESEIGDGQHLDKKDEWESMWGFKVSPER